ncbi:Pre-SET motif [Teratosphaeria destructans]|uniref:Pre-SET motif n=1 Tax=Teratosphaeria destructans TaxID=418781 RepID=A0A9W7T102_9PEZI|nr:Pre-SET motif [Teratosphaeria destructans]
MPTNALATRFGGGAKYRVYARDVSKVLCHRHKDGGEQYLLQWKSTPGALPSQAICSWHPLAELVDTLHHVQKYLETIASRSEQPVARGNFLANRKRKEPGGDPLPPQSGGLFTPSDSLKSSSREGSVTSISSDVVEDDPQVYNGVLQRKAGRITAKKPRSRLTPVSHVEATKLPTKAMLRAAANADIDGAARLIRNVFIDKLKSVNNVMLENHVDNTTPSLDFDFIPEYVMRDGTWRVSEEFNAGCGHPCRPNMGQNIGCEYTRQCDCLEYAQVEEGRAASSTNPQVQQRYREYLQQKKKGEVPDGAGLPKRFPYHYSRAPGVPQTLVAFYRESRSPIYECNDKCNCGPLCKSRVVQKGRRVPLIIFKTPNRGWGIKCGEDLIKGEFIDTYLGEVITNAEADERELRGGRAKASYLYSLDKFVGDDPELTEDTCFVVDGQYMGSVTRFMNHSCEPNCRQYTVSYNKHDLRVYDLAFFAYEDIPAGTELTFDYMDKDEEEEEEVLRKRAEAAVDPGNQDWGHCNCGAKKCRGYLWV